MYFTGECDAIQSGEFKLRISSGTTTLKFPINITDDNVYEGDESFTLTIVNLIPDYGIKYINPFKVKVTIIDDEKSKQFLLVYVTLFVKIQHNGAYQTFSIKHYKKYKNAFHKILTVIKQKP